MNMRLYTRILLKNKLSDACTYVDVDRYNSILASANLTLSLCWIEGKGNVVSSSSLKVRQEESWEDYLLLKGLLWEGM